MSEADYSYFDALVDSVFVLNKDKGISYCNESAAKLFESSVRRLSKGRPLSEFAKFSNENLFTNDANPMQEVHFELLSGAKTGKVQMATQPFVNSQGETGWIAVIRDVTLEEALHAKHHKQLQELEAYSKNLEAMVQERTAQVQRANIMLAAIMNSLGQGFLVFDRDGTCSDFYTKACEDILEAVPAHKKIWDVLKLNPNEIETFRMWTQATFSEQLPFDSMKDLGPSAYKHSQERHVRLDYFPIRTEDNKIANVVQVATDWTNEYLAQQALEKEKKYARMIIKLVTSKRQFASFLDTVPAVLRECRKLALDAQYFDHETSFRLLHTLEGEAGIYSALRIWQASRHAQEVIEPVRRKETTFTTAIHASYTQAINHLEAEYKAFLEENSELFSLAGMSGSQKLELEKNHLSDVIHHLRAKAVSSDTIHYLEDELMRETVVSSLNHYNDVISDVAARLSKKVYPIDFKGGDLRLFTDNYQNLFSSLVHAFRNAVDHGLEGPEDREMMGKDPAGRLVFTSEFFELNNRRWIRFELTDDGQGIDASRIRAKFEGSTETDEQIIQHVFDPGLTTRTVVGEFSGRGVGLNAVKTEAEALGGRAIIKTEIGKGSQLIVEVPDLGFPNSQKLSA